MAQLGRATDDNGLRTTDDTMQKVIAAMYTNSSQSPLMAGGQVSGTSGLTYQVSAGVGVVRTSEGAVFVAWPDTETAATSAPDSGTATDVIYVDRNGAVHVARGAAAPNSVVLDIRSIAAGATATSATTSLLMDKTWALAYGASYGELAYWQENAAPGSTAAASFALNMGFRIATDRLIEVEIAQELYTYHATMNTNDLYSAAIHWTVTLDGNRSFQFELPCDRRRMVQQHTVMFRGVTAGDHTVRVARRTIWTAPSASGGIRHFGGSDGWQNGYYRIRDAGPVA